jgi:micrococcal nuclease
MKNCLWMCVWLMTTSCSTTNHQNHQSKNISAVNSGPMSSCEYSETSFNCVEVVSVYDGDTIFINLPGQHPLFGKRMGVRIIGIDICEKNKALEAKEALEKILKNSHRIDIVDVQKDKYFRILGKVLADGKNVAQELIDAKLGFPYLGEKKNQRNWCR